MHAISICTVTKWIFQFHHSIKPGNVASPLSLNSLSSFEYIASLEETQLCFLEWNKVQLPIKHHTFHLLYTFAKFFSITTYIEDGNYSQNHRSIHLIINLYVPVQFSKKKKSILPV